MHVVMDEQCAPPRWVEPLHLTQCVQRSLARRREALAVQGIGRRHASHPGSQHLHSRQPRPLQRWAHSRFDGPHLRDDLIDRGVMVETLETATTWSNLTALREAVRAALPGLLVGCHVSHLYPTGASLYFTVLGRRSDDPAAQWLGLKAAATDAIVAAGGTITHHHAVGRDHAPWMAADKVIAKGKKIAARMLEAAEADIVFADARFSVAGTDRGVTLREVARAAFQPAQLPPGVEPGLYETGTFSPKQDTWPNGTHVCEVEIDPETGVVTLDRYVLVDDVGTVINPLTLKGQIHGTEREVAVALNSLVAASGADEVLVTMNTYDLGRRLDSYRRLSALFRG